MDSVCIDEPQRRCGSVKKSVKEKIWVTESKSKKERYTPWQKLKYRLNGEEVQEC